jgi:hypothetical protein
MPRTLPTSRAYALENAAFLRHLRRTGNAHEAARALATSRSRFTKRRAKDPAFAARWDAALVIAQASLSCPARAEPPRLQRQQSCRWKAAEGGGPRPKAVVEGPLRSNASSDTTPHLLLRADGTVQLRRRLPTAISPAAEQRFLTGARGLRQRPPRRARRRLLPRQLLRAQTPPPRLRAPMAGGARARV